jgi:hypothetical protein
MGIFPIIAVISTVSLYNIRPTETTQVFFQNSTFQTKEIMFAPAIPATTRIDIEQETAGFTTGIGLVWRGAHGRIAFERAQGFGLWSAPSCGDSLG